MDKLLLGWAAHHLSEYSLTKEKNDFNWSQAKQKIGTHLRLRWKVVLLNFISENHINIFHLFPDSYITEILFYFLNILEMWLTQDTEEEDLHAGVLRDAVQW